MRTREKFMQFFRDNEKLNLLTPDDRIEIFKTILLGSSDITKELLEEIISDYNVPNLKITKVMKLNKEQFIAFMEIVRQSLIENKSWRFGQAIWNEGSTLYPELFGPYRGTEYDPFYSNERVNSLFEKILDEEALEAWYSSNLYLKTITN